MKKGREEEERGGESTREERGKGGGKEEWTEGRRTEKREMRKDRGRRQFKIPMFDKYIYCM